MASVLSHPAVPLAIACWTPSLRRPSLLIAGALLSAAPDLDVIGYWAGVPYDAWCGHRGFTHSIAFALCCALALAPALARWCGVPVRRVVAYFWAAMASHGVVDMATNGGYGIALFWPFSTARMFWPCNPIEVATLSVGAFFSEHGMVVLQSELIWLWLPAALIGGVGLFRTRRRPDDHSRGEKPPERFISRS